MQRSSEASAINRKIKPAAAIWKDTADDEEWSAWADGATQESISLIYEQDEFGAWVDSSDPDDSLHFQTPASSPHISAERAGQQDTMSMQKLGQLDRPELAAHTLKQLNAQSSSIPSEHVTVLYSNPWDDDHPALDERGLQDQYDHDDDDGMDPEIDSALASSAWESVLAEDRFSVKDSDDEESTFEAWSIGDHRGSEEPIREKEEVHRSEAQCSGNFYDTGVEINTEQQSDGRLEWYNTDFSTVTGTEVKQPTWMQRLTGNRSKQSRSKVAR